MKDEAAFRNTSPPTPNHTLLAEFMRYGIVEETMREFEISHQITGGLNGSVIIPLHDPFGSHMGYVAVSDSGNRVIVPATLGADQLLYNCHRAVATGSKQVIVVQDLLDCLRVSQCGFRAVVALLGPLMSETQEIELVTRFRAVVLMFRGDDAGWALSQNCVRRLVTQVSVHAAVLPANQAARDLNERDLVAVLRYSALVDR